MIDKAISVLLAQQTFYLDEQSTLDRELIERMEADLLRLINNQPNPESVVELAHAKGVVECNYGNMTASYYPKTDDDAACLRLTFNEGTVLRAGTNTSSIIHRKLTEWLDLELVYGGKHRLNAEISGSKVRVKVYLN